MSAGFSGFVDFLSHILRSSRLSNHILVRKRLHGSWGFRFPCQKSGGFHIILSGTALLRHDGRDTQLGRGDIAFVMRGLEHELLSDAKQKAVDVSSLKQTADRAGAASELLSVRYEFPDGEMHPFFQELPSMLVLRAGEIAMHHPLQAVLGLLSAEQESHAGSALVIERLTDVLLYYVLRRWLDENQTKRAGYSRAARDEKLLLVLNRIHADAANAWTIERLARSVGLSRATLAARFRAALGMSVMEYVIRTRLAEGQRLLADGTRTLEEVARETGYSSAFAFSKAHKRVFGRSPRLKSA